MYIDDEKALDLKSDCLGLAVDYLSGVNATLAANAEAPVLYGGAEIVEVAKAFFDWLTDA